MHTMHKKDLVIIILVVLVLALIADDENILSDKIGNLADNIDSRDRGRGLTSSAIADPSSAESVDDVVKAADKLFSKGESQFKLASSAYDKLEWADCINRCLSARNYYNNAADEFEMALDELDENREESGNKVFRAFIDKSIEYYTCIDDLTEMRISVCETMETACLHYSRDENSKGNNIDDDLQVELETYEEEETKCNDILENVN